MSATSVIESKPSETLTVSGQNHMTQFKTILSLLTLLLSTFAIGQRKNDSIVDDIYIAGDNRFQLDSAGYHGATALDTMYYPDNKIKAIGHVALESDSSKSKLKVGSWTEYFPSGTIKSEGSYQIDSYIQCCSDGACRMFINYKTGSWQYYHENGQLKCSGIYVVAKEHIKTSCKGGARVYRARINKSWKCHNEQGQEIVMNAAMKKELEDACQ